MVIETDHKPLVQLLTKKQVESLPLRILCFQLQLKDLLIIWTMYHVPGKLLYTTYTLSRSSVTSTDICELALQDEAELFATVAITNLPANTQRVDVYKSEQMQYSSCVKIANYCQRDCLQNMRSQQS